MVIFQGNSLCVFKNTNNSILQEKEGKFPSPPNQVELIHALDGFQNNSGKNANLDNKSFFHWLSF